MIAPTESVYCLDTTALIYLADTYSADAFPDVWEQLARLVDGKIVMAPREVRRELERKEDNGALSWAKANSSLFHDLDSDQCGLVSQIISSPRFSGLVDLDAELPDADPFVVALALTHSQRTGFFAARPAVVGVDTNRVSATLSNVCGDNEFQLRFLSPHQMLREVDLEVPEPDTRGLVDLYGIWHDIDFSEEEIEKAKWKARGISD